MMRKMICNTMSPARRPWHWLFPLAFGLSLFFVALRSEEGRTQEEKAPPILRAGGLVIVDKKGRERIILETDGARCAVRCIDQNGKLNAGIAINEANTAALALGGADGPASVVAYLSPEGVGGLAIADRKGANRIDLSVKANGDVGIRVRDDKERPRAMVGLLPDGTALVGLAASENENAISMHGSPAGDCAFRIEEGHGKYRALIQLDKRGPMLLRLYDEDGKRVFQAP